MLPENIKKLLDSDNEADNLVGWELVDAQEVAHRDVIDYVQKTRVPIQWVQKYKWDGVKYIRNDKTPLSQIKSQRPQRPMGEGIARYVK